MQDIYQEISEKYNVNRPIIIKYHNETKCSLEELEKHYADFSKQKKEFLERSIELQSVIEKYKDIIDRESILKYSKSNPDLSVKDIDDHYAEFLETKAFKEECEKHNISYTKARNYKRDHPEKSVEEIIKYYTTDKISDIARSINVHPNLFFSMMRNHPEMSIQDIIDYYTNNAKIKCEKAGVNYKSFLTYKNGKHKDKTEEEIIDILKKSQQKSLKELCKEENLKYILVKQFSYNHPELRGQSQKVIDEYKRYIEERQKQQEFYKNKKELKRKQIEENKLKKSFKERCQELNLSYTGFISYKGKHKNQFSSDEEAFQFYADNFSDKSVSLKELCEQYNVDYRKIIKYKYEHKVSDNNKAIVHFRPDLYINIFGEICKTS